MNGQITNYQDAMKYLTAGRATFTLVSKKTGARYTYRTRVNGLFYFVDLLTGPDNTTDYTYQGFFKDAGEYVAGRKDGCLPAFSPSIRAIAWFIHQARKGETDMHPNLEFWHDGTCGACGRKLTDPESVAAGLGPVCRSKHG